MNFLRKSLLFSALISCSNIPVTRKEIEKWSSLPIEEQIIPFVSDGCSYYPEGTLKNKTKWLGCCIAHDLTYWRGGTHQERREADRKLAACVDKKGEDVASKVMYLGTRIGGQAEYDTSYRWGYGWRYRRGYLAVTPSENKAIQKFRPKRSEDLRKYLSEGFKQSHQLDLNFLSLETIED